MSKRAAARGPRLAREMAYGASSSAEVVVAMRTSAQRASPYREDHSFFDKIVSNSNENYERRGRTTQFS